MENPEPYYFTKKPLIYASRDEQTRTDNTDKFYFSKKPLNIGIQEQDKQPQSEKPESYNDRPSYTPNTFDSQAQAKHEEAKSMKLVFESGHKDNPNVLFMTSGRNQPAPHPIFLTLPVQGQPDRSYHPQSLFQDLSTHTPFEQRPIHHDTNHQCCLKTFPLNPNHCPTATNINIPQNSYLGATHEPIRNSFTDTFPAVPTGSHPWRNMENFNKPQHFDFQNTHPAMHFPVSPPLEQRSKNPPINLPQTPNSKQNSEHPISEVPKSNTQHSNFPVKPIFDNQQTNGPTMTMVSNFKQPSEIQTYPSYTLNPAPLQPGKVFGGNTQHFHSPVQPAGFQSTQFDSSSLPASGVVRTNIQQHFDSNVQANSNNQPKGTQYAPLTGSSRFEDTSGFQHPHTDSSSLSGSSIVGTNIQQQFESSIQPNSNIQPKGSQYLISNTGLQKTSMVGPQHDFSEISNQPIVNPDFQQRPQSIEERDWLQKNNKANVEFNPSMKNNFDMNQKPQVNIPKETSEKVLNPVDQRFMDASAYMLDDSKVSDQYEPIVGASLDTMPDEAIVGAPLDATTTTTTNSPTVDNTEDNKEEEIDDVQQLKSNSDKIPDEPTTVTSMEDSEEAQMKDFQKPKSTLTAVVTKMQSFAEQLRNSSEVTPIHSIYAEEGSGDTE